MIPECRNPYFTSQFNINFRWLASSWSDQAWLNGKQTVQAVNCLKRAGNLQWEVQGEWKPVSMGPPENGWDKMVFYQSLAVKRCCDGLPLASSAQQTE